MIETGGVLTRGVELSVLIEIELIPVNMDASAADEVNDMSVGGASVSRAPSGNITHQYVADISL